MYWINMGFKSVLIDDFAQNSRNHDFRIPETLSLDISQHFSPIHGKNQGNRICGFKKKCVKPSILAIFDHLAQNGRFWTDTDQNVQFSSFP